MDFLVDQFINNRESQFATAKTISWHRQSLGKFKQYWHQIGEPHHETWTAATLTEFTRYLRTTTNHRGKKLSDASIRTHVNSVWAFCRFLYQHDFIKVDIAEKAKKPRLAVEQKTAFSDREAADLIAAAGRSSNPYRDAALLLLLLDTGIRATEACNLTVNDVLNHNNLLLVRQGKGRKDRTVAMSPKTSLAITRYIVRERGTPKDHDQPLFLAKGDKKMTAGGLLQMIYRVAKAAGVSDAHPHRFRRTFAIMYLRNGGDPLSLQRAMGHTSLEMTNKYVDMMTEDLVRVHSKASPVANLK